MNCSHDSRAVCFLCSDDVPWWREARITAGYGETPPNAVVKDCTVVPAALPPAELRRKRFMKRKWDSAYWSRKRARAV